jgi:iron complex transport system substrate-binding protein
MLWALFAGSPLVWGQHVFHDALGREVVLAEEPKRIVSLAPNITEILYALKLGDRVVGVTRFSDYPEEAKEKPKLGSYINPNVEKIVALEPDLILATYGGNPEARALHLERLGLALYVTRPKTIEDVLVMINNIGMITGAEHRAATLVSRLRQRIKTVRDRVLNAQRPLVFLEISARPLMTVGAGSFHDQMIALAGGKNLAGDISARYPQYSLEEVVKRAPDLILISTMERSGQFEQQKARWMQWDSIPAVANNRICFIDSDLIDRASPRIVEGIEEIARLIHPELF